MADAPSSTQTPMEAFVAAGVVSRADLAITSGLARMAGVPVDSPTGLAIALALRALRAGSVCLDLRADPRIWAPEEGEAEGAAQSGASATDAPGTAEELPWPHPDSWLAEVAASPLVATSPLVVTDPQAAEQESARPLRLVGDLLYLHRYWSDEATIRSYLARQTPGKPSPEVVATVARLFGDQASRQRDAVQAAATNPVTVVAGGPGTGKTTTVARMLAVSHLLDPRRRILLAAPTGKAAARLSQAVSESLLSLDPSLRDGLSPPAATTIHRMLGWRPGFRNRFRHDSRNPLPVDLVVVDEASMVSLPLMARLVEAIPPGAQLVLVGDPNQLASVEAGAVLADLVAPPTPLPVVELDHTWRFGGMIADLASAVRAGDPDAVVRLARSGDPALSWYEPEPDQSDEEIAADSGLRADVVSCDLRIRSAAQAGDAREALAALDEHRALCAHREGRFGAAHWDELAASWIGQGRRHGSATADAWPVGQPLLITANDYSTELFNGDTGVIVATPEGPRAAFSRGSEPLVYPPSRLSHVVRMRAMTVHRAQGSQFGSVSVVLPGPESPILTRELLYTALTRARTRVRLIATEEAVRAAVSRRVVRASGLRSPTDAPPR